MEHEIKETIREEKVKKKISVQHMVLVGMFTAVLAVMSQLSIPLPSGVPMTLQVFAVTLVGLLLGWKLGVITVLIYILVGASGAPVFANFKGGLGAITGFSGGFLWGFIFLALFSGLAVKLSNRVLGFMVVIAGILLCYLCGFVQFSILSGTSFGEVVKTMTVLYLPKDVVSVVAAYIVERYMSRILRKVSVYNNL